MSIIITFLVAALSFVVCAMLSSSTAVTAVSLFAATMLIVSASIYAFRNWN